MIIKTYKRIHNKYSNIFKSLLFIRYVFGIFLVAITLFIVIPKFFNYEKKQDIISSFLKDNYNLEIKNYKTIKYNILPIPNLLLQNVEFKIKDQSIFLKSKKVNIFLNLNNIYDYNKFKPQKVVISENSITLDIDQTKQLLNYFKKLRSNLKVKSLNLFITRSGKKIFKMQNLNFLNYGSQKFRIDGEMFGKELRMLLNNDNKNLNFVLKNTGVEADFKFDETNTVNSISGSSKVNLLDNLLKYDFNLYDDKLKISNLNFRNRKISFFSNALIKFNPFFNFNFKINIKEFDVSLIHSVNFENLEKYRSILKKLNGKTVIEYKNDKYFSGLIDFYSSTINLAHGRIKFSNQTKIANTKINCQGESSLIAEFPRLNFTCKIDIEEKRKLLKKFSLSSKDNNPINVDIEGSINLLKKKINFTKINSLNNYQANEEDLNFFKEKFESNLLEGNIFEMFDKDKIKIFLLEII